MSAVCACCGQQKTSFGNRIVRKGLPKKSGGIGLHTTGISRRTFKRNLQKMRIRLPNGAVKRAWVCTRCLRAGKVEKAG